VLCCELVESGVVAGVGIHCSSLLVEELVVFASRNGRLQSWRDSGIRCRRRVTLTIRDKTETG